MHTCGDHSSMLRWDIITSFLIRFLLSILLNGYLDIPLIAIHKTITSNEMTSVRGGGLGGEGRGGEGKSREGVRWKRKWEDGRETENWRSYLEHNSCSRYEVNHRWISSMPPANFQVIPMQFAFRSPMTGRISRVSRYKIEKGDRKRKIKSQRRSTLDLAEVSSIRTKISSSSAG